MTADEAKWFLDGIDAAITTCEHASEGKEEIKWSFQVFDSFLIYNGDIAAEALGLKLERDRIEENDYYSVRRGDFVYKDRRYSYYRFLADAGDKEKTDGLEQSKPLSQD